MVNSEGIQIVLKSGEIKLLHASKLSASTVRSVLSHIRTLERNGIQINRDSLVTSTVETLNKLKDKNNKSLTSQYKRQIGMTIKRLFPGENINLKPFAKERGNVKSTRLSSSVFVGYLKKIIERASFIIGLVNKKEYIHDLGLYDTCIAILITSSADLPLHDILDLKIKHIDNIKNNQSIDIKTKGYKNLRYIAPNDLLLEVFNSIIAQRDKVKKNVDMRIFESSDKHQKKRIDDNFIIVSSEDYMRKKLHELAASLLIPKGVLGFKAFRSYHTIILAEGVGRLIAQSMNNNGSNSEASETTHKRLNKLMKNLVPHSFIIKKEFKEEPIAPVKLKKENENIIPESKMAAARANVDVTTDPNSTRTLTIKEEHKEDETNVSTPAAMSKFDDDYDDAHGASSSHVYYDQPIGNQRETFINSSFDVEMKDVLNAAKRSNEEHTITEHKSTEIEEDKSTDNAKKRKKHFKLENTTPEEQTAPATTDMDIMYE